MTPTGASNPQSHVNAQGRFFSTLEPAEAREDTDAALLVWRATNSATPFFTAKSCHRLLQRTRPDTQNALLRVSTYQIAGGAPLLTPIPISEAGPVAWRLSQSARRRLGIPQPGLAAATKWVRERRRISTAEYRALTGVSNPTAVAHLKTLTQEEGLVPSRPSGRGPGFHYRYPQGWLGGSESHSNELAPSQLVRCPQTFARVSFLWCFMLLVGVVGPSGGFSRLGFGRVRGVARRAGRGLGRWRCARAGRRAADGSTLCGWGAGSC